MRTFAVLCFVLSLCLNAEYVSSKQVDFLDLGAGVTHKGDLLSHCYYGDEEKVTFEIPRVHFEMATVLNDGNGTAEVHVSMFFLKSYSQINNVKARESKNGGIQYEKLCTNEYIARVYNGLQISFSNKIGYGQAKELINQGKLSAYFLMEEKDEHTFSEFFKIVASQMSNITTYLGGAVNITSTGTGAAADLEDYLDMSIEDAFENYRVKAQNSTNARLGLGAEFKVFNSL